MQGNYADLCFDYGAIPSVTGAILVSSNQACFADCPATTVDSVYYGDPEDICERPPPPCSNNFPSGCTCTGSTLTSCTAHDASSGGTTLDLSWNGINGGLGRRIRWAVACDHHQPEHNSITAVSAGVFTGLSSLTVLKLAHNSITAISATSFTGLSTVTSLQLSDNSISAMPAGTFSSFPIYLDLGGGNDLSVSTTAQSRFCLQLVVGTSLPRWRAPPIAPPPSSPVPTMATLRTSARSRNPVTCLRTLALPRGPGVHERRVRHDVLLDVLHRMRRVHE